MTPHCPLKFFMIIAFALFLVAVKMIFIGLHRFEKFEQNLRMQISSPPPLTG